MPPKRTRAAQPRTTRATTTSHANQFSDKRCGISRDERAHDDSTNDSNVRRIRAPARNGRGRGQTKEMGENYMMTGALPAEDDDAPVSARVQKTPGQARPRGRLGRKIVHNDAQAQALEALKRRMEQEQGKKADDDGTAPMSAAAALAERKKKRTSGASMDDSVAVQSPALRTVHHMSQVEDSSSPAVASVSPPRGRPREVVPSSAVKAQGTPMAENSVLALSKFKRRPRQPSILRMVGATSDVENNDNASDDSEDLTLNYTLGDFEPDHESTPLHLQKSRKSQGGESEARTSSSRKRKFQELDFEENEESEIQVPASSPPVLSHSHLAVREPSSEHLYSDASDLPQHVPDTQDPPLDEDGEPLREPSREATPEIHSETQAASNSSSSLPSMDEPDDPSEAVPETAPNRRSLRQPQRLKTTQDEPESSSSGTGSDNDTETPVRSRKRSTRSKAPKAEPKPTKQRPLTTSALASLLPRRRKPQRQRGNAKDPLEIPSSTSDEENFNRRGGSLEVRELSPDEDELLHDPPPRQRGKSTAAAKTKRSADSTRRKGKANGDTATQKKREAGQPSKTYGRSRVSSDKENQNTEIEDVDPRKTDDGSGDEGRGDLAKVAQKFAEIDKWEMEFESVSAEAGAGASSPWR